MALLNPVVIQEFHDIPCELWFEETHLGTIKTYYSLLDVQWQIKRENKYGYYVIFKGKKIPFDKEGTLKEYPDGFFDTMSKLCYKLM